MPYEDRYCSVSYKGGEIAAKFHKVRIWSVMDGSEQSGWSRRRKYFSYFLMIL